MELTFGHRNHILQLLDAEWLAYIFIFNISPFSRHGKGYRESTARWQHKPQAQGSEEMQRNFKKLLKKNKKILSVSKLLTDLNKGKFQLEAFLKSDGQLNCLAKDAN